MATRREARLRAVQILFEADQRELDPLEVLGAHLKADAAPDLGDDEGAAGSGEPLSEFTVELVEGVCANRAAIDEALSTYSRGWTLDRMPATDRAVLRVGAWELIHSNAPDEVAVAEAVRLATQLSTDESPSFVNGLLARVKDMKHTLA